MDTDELIRVLASQAQPVQRLRPPLWRTAALLCLALPVFFAGALMHGLRPDLRPLLGDARFDLEMAGSLLTGIAAIYVAFQAAIPGWSPLILMIPLGPALVWASALGYGCFAELRGPDGIDLATSFFCLRNIIGMSIGPIAVLLLMLRRARPFNPGLVTMLGVLGIASLASAVLNTYHALDSSIMVLIWHLGSIGCLVTLSRVIARRFALLGSTAIDARELAGRSSRPVS